MKRGPLTAWSLLLTLKQNGWSLPEWLVMDLSLFRVRRRLQVHVLENDQQLEICSGGGKGGKLKKTEKTHFGEKQLEKKRLKQKNQRRKTLRRKEKAFGGWDFPKMRSLSAFPFFSPRKLWTRPGERDHVLRPLTARRKKSEPAICLESPSDPK